MSRRTMGIILIALGGIGAVVSLAADMLGIGSYPGINGSQILEVVVSLIIAAVGIWLAQSKAG